MGTPYNQVMNAWFMQHGLVCTLGPRTHLVAHVPVHESPLTTTRPRDRRYDHMGALFRRAADAL